MGKKIIIFCCLLVGILSVTGCKKQRNTSESTEPYSVESDSIDSKEMTNLREKYSFSDTDIPALLNEFGSKFINFTSIDQRNQEVKNYLTEECITANGMNQSAYADFQSEGEITSVYQQTEETNNYLIIGTEKMNNTQSTIVIEVTLLLENSDVKISKLVINYMKQAY